MTNIFDPKQKVLAGKVVVTQMENPFGRGKTVNKVLRNTADDAAVVGEMAEHTDIVKKNDMTAVMSAFVSSVQALVSRGNAVRISGLGTFYITAEEDEAADGEKCAFGISFTPDNALSSAAAKAKAEVVKRSERDPAIESVQDMDTMECNGRLTSGKAAEITGHRLKVACGAGAKATECGIFMVPCDDAGSYKADMSDWVRVKDGDIGKNVMTQVLFRVPKGLKGKYRLAVRTKAPLCGSAKETLLLKKARTSISGEVFDVT